MELMIIALANVVYYVAANDQEPGIVRVQDKTDAIYKIIYTQTDYRTWILMDIVLGILFLLSVFLPDKKILPPAKTSRSTRNRIPPILNCGFRRNLLLLRRLRCLEVAV